MTSEQHKQNESKAEKKLNDQLRKNKLHFSQSSIQIFVYISKEREKNARENREK